MPTVLKLNDMAFDENGDGSGGYGSGSGYGYGDGSDGSQ